MLPPWVIVLTKSTAEETVERSLRQAGYRAYLPRYRRLLSPHGHARQPTLAMRPLFTRMVFAQEWRGWPKLSITGATGLMQARPGLAMLCDADVALVMERERMGDFDMASPKGVRADLAIGDGVEFELAFGAKVMGVLEELTPQGKAVVSAMIFGRIVRTEVRATSVNRAYGLSR